MLAAGLLAATGTATSADVQLRELAPGVWMHTSWHVVPSGARKPSNGLVVREGGLLTLVDTAWGVEATGALLAEIEREIGLPVARAVVTHAHVDRVAGVDLLEARGIEVLATPLLRERAAAQGLPVPARRLDGLARTGDARRLGALELMYPGPGHAPDNIVVWLPAQRLLFGGCAVRETAIPFPGNLDDADVAAWPGAIARVAARYPDARIVVPGHGEPGGAELLTHTLTIVRKPAR